MSEYHAFYPIMISLTVSSSLFFLSIIDGPASSVSYQNTVLLGHVVHGRNVEAVRKRNSTGPLMLGVVRFGLVRLLHAHRHASDGYRWLVTLYHIA
jgi:hypothetical protein